MHVLQSMKEAIFLLCSSPILLFLSPFFIFFLFLPLLLLLRLLLLIRLFASSSFLLLLLGTGCEPAENGMQFFFAYFSTEIIFVENNEKLSLFVFLVTDLMKNKRMLLKSLNGNREQNMKMILNFVDICGCCVKIVRFKCLFSCIKNIRKYLFSLRTDAVCVDSVKKFYFSNIFISFRNIFFHFIFFTLIHHLSSFLFTLFVFRVHAFCVFYMYTNELYLNAGWKKSFEWWYS